MGGVGWPDVCLRGVADGCVALARDATSIRRPRRARCIADGWRRLKGSPCLRRAGERHTLVNALGRTSYTPQPKVPRGISEPRSVGARIPCPGRGSHCPSPARDFLAWPSRCAAILARLRAFHFEPIGRAACSPCCSNCQARRSRFGAT